MLVPLLESGAVFSDEHSSCESWTVGVGVPRASKMMSDLTKGRAPSCPQGEVPMTGSVEVLGGLLALGDNSRAMLDARIASRAWY